MFACGFRARSYAIDSLAKIADVKSYENQARRSHICTGTESTPAHVCTGTRLAPAHICTRNVAKYNALSWATKRHLRTTRNARTCWTHTALVCARAYRFACSGHAADLLSSVLSPLHLPRCMCVCVCLSVPKCACACALFLLLTHNACYRVFRCSTVRDCVFVHMPCPCACVCVCVFVYVRACVLLSMCLLSMALPLRRSRARKNASSYIRRHVEPDPCCCVACRDVSSHANRLFGHLSVLSFTAASCASTRPRCCRRSQQS